jgi:hypothetical protein
VAVDTYGCTFDDVDELLVWDARRATNPAAPSIDTWIEVGAAELAGLIGDLAPTPEGGDPPPCAGDGWRARARMVVALYAAAMAEDAHYPERAGRQRNADVGARFWERHREQRDALVKDLEACRDGLEPGTARGGSGHTFPLIPLVTRDMGT